MRINLSSYIAAQNLQSSLINPGYGPLKAKMVTLTFGTYKFEHEDIKINLNQNEDGVKMDKEY